MSLTDVKHWVFDMDGTLTVAVHDFAAIRVALEIPPEDDILTHLAALPADEAAAKHAWLLEHERELALGSLAAEGAVELVRELAGRGYRLGILTRNARELAHVTLEAIGLADCFATEDVLGRDDAPPKPAPGGLLKLAAAWDVAPSEMVMSAITASTWIVAERQVRGRCWLTCPRTRGRSWRIGMPRIAWRCVG